MRVLKTGLVFAALLAASSAAQAACQPDRIHLRSDAGQAAFTIEIADEPEERALGLMHRDSMARFTGMLFVFEGPQRAVFWMENTLIPLDMLFIDETGTVRHVHHNAIPLDRTGIDGGEGVTHVLEINGGMARQLNIDVGTQVRHPSIAAENAAWPCGE